MFACALASCLMRGFWPATWRPTGGCCAPRRPIWPVTARPGCPNDLARHNCIGIRQGGEAYGTWRLSQGKRTQTVKVRGNLSTNDGEIAVNWALDGHGILMRAEWDIGKYLRSGRLLQVLENYHLPPADIHAVYPQRHQTSVRVRAFVDFLASHFDQPPYGPRAWQAPGKAGQGRFYCRMRPVAVTMVSSTNFEPERMPGLKPSL